MTSSDNRSGELPHFPIPRVQLMLGGLLAAAVAVIALILCFASLLDGQIASAVAELCFAVFVSTVAAFAWSNQPSDNTGDRVRRWVEASTVHYKVGGLVLLGIIVGSLTGTILAFGLAAGGGILPIFVVLGICLATFFIPISTRSIRNGRVELTTNGIRHRGWSFESEVAWDAVVDVSFARRNYPAIDILVDPSKPIRRRNTTRLWRIETLHPGHVLELDCRRFDVHLMVLAQWIQFYIDNPAARVELGTDFAAKRLRSASPLVS